jgi:hypothetical protein
MEARFMSRQRLEHLLVCLAVTATVWLGGRAGAEPPASAPSTLPGNDLQTLRREAAAQLESRLRPLASIGTLDVEKVVQFTVVDNDLQIHTQMQPTHGAVRVRLANIAGEASLNVRGSPVRGLAGIQFLQLMHEDTTRANAINVRTQIFASPQYLQIARDFELPGEDISISLIQNLQSRLAQLEDADGEGAVKFFVKGMKEETGETTVDIKLSADNIVELIRQHPREMGLYFEPVLRDLHQADAVFGIEPAVAWQVFAPEVHADAAMQQEIARLIPQLGARKVAERQAAADALRKLGPAGAVELMHFDRKNLSPEQNARLDELLGPYQSLSKQQADELRDSPDFLLNCLGSTDARLRHVALARLVQRVGHPLTFDPDADRETRERQLAALRQKLITPGTTRPGE